MNNSEYQDCRRPSVFRLAEYVKDDLVDDQQDTELFTDKTDLRPVAARRHDHAAGTLDGLGDESGDLRVKEVDDS